MREPALKIRAVRNIGVTLILNISTMQDFVDSVQAEYSTRNVYARPDPIITYTNTARKITMNWVAQTHRSPFLLSALRSLQQMLYASYADYGGRKIIKEPPLFHLSFGTANFGGDGQKASEFQMTPYLQLKNVYGVFDKFDVQLFEGKAVKHRRGNTLPDRVAINSTFTVLHNHFPAIVTKGVTITSIKGGGTLGGSGRGGPRAVPGEVVDEASTARTLTAEATEVVEATDTESVVGSSYTGAVTKSITTSGTGETAATQVLYGLNPAATAEFGEGYHQGRLSGGVDIESPEQQAFLRDVFEAEAGGAEVKRIETRPNPDGTYATEAILRDH
jgi:hypothetical protein